MQKFTDYELVDILNTRKKIPADIEIMSGFIGSKENQPAMCAKFGCGKKLTLTESLCGKFCLKCSNISVIDITKIIKL